MGADAALTAHRALIIIPARYASLRFPGKPLSLLRAPDGTVKPLIAWVWEAAARAADIAETVVATDDRRIADTVEAFGGKAVMTSTTARNGTERCAEVLASLDREPGLVINLQGDSPLVRRSDIAALIAASRASSAPMVTPFVTCTPAMEAAILAETAAGRVGGTTVVIGQDGNALYFSKCPIPFRSPGAPPLKLHLGLYGYTPAALRRYAEWPPGILEQVEGLEQLRFLEHGVPVKTFEVPVFPDGFAEVNNPEDVAIVERALSPG